MNWNPRTTIFGPQGMPCAEVPGTEGKRGVKVSPKGLRTCPVDFSRTGRKKCKKCGKEFNLQFDNDELQEYLQKND